MSRSMRILGIDPGLQIAGFGVIDVEGQTLRYVASGTIKTAHMVQAGLPARLKVLYEGIRLFLSTSTRKRPCCWARRGAPASPPWSHAIWL